VVDVNDPAGNHTSFTYDTKGNMLSQTNGLGKSWTYEYDPLDRLIKQTNPLDNSTMYEYDLLGRKTAVTNARGNKTQHEYSALDRLIKVIDALDQETRYEYDAVGNLTTIINANDKASSRQYDALNRLIAESDPLDNTIQYQYDEVGNPIAKTDAMDQTTTYEYDQLDRLTKVNYPDDTHVTYEYDENGNMISMTDWNGTSTFEYDLLNRMVANTDAFSNRIEYEYDPTDNRTAIIYPDNKTVTYTYDDFGRLETVTDWNGRITTHTYDVANNLKSISLPNSSSQSYDYDDASRLISVQNKDSGAGSIGSFAYTLDRVGNRTEIDEIGTLTPSLPFSDANYTYDDADRIITDGSSSYSFDDTGNQIQRDSGGLITDYTYDSKDQLVGVDEPGLSVEHITDGVGNRIARKVNGTEKRFVLDLASPMSQVLCEADPNGNITAYYTYGVGLLSKIESDGSESYYHYDGLGSTVVLTDESGNLTDRYTYTPFGEMVNSEGSTDNNFKYVGRFGVMTEPDGTLFMRARFYDPATGRFLSKDPVQGSFDNPLTLNEYLYASSNPMKNIDPQGEFFLESLALGMTIETITVVFELGAAAGLITNEKAAEIRFYGEVLTSAVTVFDLAVAGPAAGGLSAGGDAIGRMAVQGFVILGRDYIGPILMPWKKGNYKAPGHLFPNMDVKATSFQVQTEDLIVDINPAVYSETETRTSH